VWWIYNWPGRKTRQTKRPMQNHNKVRGSCLIT
jgi:hypothetical protein